jgi:hypothetical protein
MAVFGRKHRILIDHAIQRDRKQRDRKQRDSDNNDDKPNLGADLLLV